MWCSSHRVCGKNCTVDDDKNHAVSMLACWNLTIGTKAKTRHFSFRELHVCRSSAYRVIIVKAIIAWRGRDWFHTRIHKRHNFSHCLLPLKRCTRQMGGYVVEVTSHKHAWPIKCRFLSVCGFLKDNLSIAWLRFSRFYTKLPWCYANKIWCIYQKRSQFE